MTLRPPEPGLSRRSSAARLSLRLALGATLALLPWFPPRVPAAMYSPELDGAGPFTYLAKPSTTIAVPGAAGGAQITWDGALLTGAAEYVVLYGDPLRPSCARTKRLAEGWLPIINWAWQAEGVRYTVEAFAGEPSSAAAAFLRLRAEPASAGGAANAVLGLGVRHTGGDHRCRELPRPAFDATARCEFASGRALRNGGELYAWSAPQAPRLLATPTRPYVAPFGPGDLGLDSGSVVLLAVWSQGVTRDDPLQVEVRLPLPGPADKPPRGSASRPPQWRYDRERAVARGAWRRRLAGSIRVEVPEQKVRETFYASLVYGMQAIAGSPRGPSQHVNRLQYDKFWIRDAAWIARAYDVAGLPRLAELCLEGILACRRRGGPDDGLIAQRDELDGVGQALWACGRHYRLTGDARFARRGYPPVRRAVAWVRRTVEADPLGLLPPTSAYDNEQIEGRYTGHDLWALCGVRLAIEMARAVGESRDAAEWEGFASTYEAALLRRLEEATAANGGCLPPGLDVPGGEPWGNLLAAYPCRVLEPWHPWVGATCERMHRERYAEGLMTYKHGLHHYLTTSITETHVVRGEQEQALRDLYALLAHTGSCHEGFERGVRPWADRDSGRNLPPHGWFAARYCLLLRNMLVREEGDDLHLLSVVSPAWGGVGEVAVRDAPTDFGLVTVRMALTPTGAEVTLAPRWRSAPRRVLVHLPYWARLLDWEADAPGERVTGPAAPGYAERDWPAWRTEGGGANEWLVLAPAVRRLRLRWERRPVETLSYAGAVVALRDEYARRAGRYVRAGKEFLPYEAPALGG